MKWGKKMGADFEQKKEEKTKQIEEIIRKYLPEEKDEYQKTLLEAMNYSMLAGGKRIRPMMALETYQMFGGEGKIIEPFLAGLEMIHTYSLVHDDLPAMDNDEYRRGRKTTHIAYGHAMGILAGDGLLNYAFETMMKAEDYLKDVSKEEAFLLLKRIFDAIRLIASKSGIYGMVGGQAVDVESTEKGKALTLEKIGFIYRLKTSALLEASMAAGAILAGAELEDVKKIESVAEKVGMAFQIQDDILDVTSTKEILGKDICQDEKNHKVTYVTIKGLEDAKRVVEQISKEAISILQSCNGRNEFLEQLINWLIHREK